MTAAAALLRSLIEIPSVNPAYDPRSPGEELLARYVGKYCGDLGMAVEFDEVAPGRPNVVATLPAAPSGAGPARTLLFEVHTDTVGLPPGQAAPVAERRGSLLAGRGACDVKGGLAAALLALAELAAGEPLARTTVCLLGAVDEEHEFRGITHHLAHRPLPAAAVVVEPTESRVAAQHSGVLRLRITVTGQAAHSSRPEEGRNAIVDALHVVERLDRWNASQPGQKLSVNRIAGGTAVNVVAASCHFDVDVRTRPADDPLAVEAEIGEQLTALGAEGVTAEISTRMIADQGLDTPGDARVVRAALAACERLEMPTEPVRLGFGSDASKLGRAGVPTVVFGPGSIRQAHADDEWIDLDDVERAARVLAELARRFDKATP